MHGATRIPVKDPTSAQMARRRRTVPLALLLVFVFALSACSGDPASTTPAGHVTPSPTVRASFMYVALGASDAVGFGAMNPNTEGYVPRLIARLPHGSGALNLGVSGYKVHDGLTQELPQALEAHPSLVTVWLVGNDFRSCTPLDQYAADLDKLLTQLHDDSHAQVFVANTPDMDQLPYFMEGAPEGAQCVAGASAATVRAMAQRWNAVINPLVAKHGDVLVDLFNSDLDKHPDYISSDGFHPSSQGYAVLADLFWKQISAHHAVPGT